MSYLRGGSWEEGRIGRRKGPLEGRPRGVEEKVRGGPSPWEGRREGEGRGRVGLPRAAAPKGGKRVMEG